MLKIFLRKLYFIYFIIFFSSITCDDNYQVNLDGEGCSDAPHDPNIPEDCTTNIILNKFFNLLSIKLLIL